MNESLLLLTLALGLVLVVVVVAAATGHLDLAKILGPQDKAAPTDKFKIRRDALLTQAEAAFAQTLDAAARRLLDELGPLRVVAKVRVADVVLPDLPSHDRSRSTSLRNSIAQQHLDFLLVDPDWKPVCAIELDDSSHNSSSAKQRDAKKTNACETAGLPLVRIRAARSYDASSIGLAVAQALHPSSPD